MRSFTLRNFIEDDYIITLHRKEQYCEALRFATSLRTEAVTAMGDYVGDCEALRFATSLRTNSRKRRPRNVSLRSFTLRNFIEET